MVSPIYIFSFIVRGEKIRGEKITGKIRGEKSRGKFAGKIRGKNSRGKSNRFLAAGTSGASGPDHQNKKTFCIGTFVV